MKSAQHTFLAPKRNSYSDDVQVYIQLCGGQLFEILSIHHSLIQYCGFIFLPLHIYWPEKQWIYPFPYFFSGTISIFFFSLHIFIGPRCPWGPIYGSWCISIHTRLCWDLTDVTLADEDSNLIPTDDVHRAILSNVAMQVAPSGAQHWN